jgi:hypothetical protein
MTPMALHHKRQLTMVKKMMKHFVLLCKMVYSQNSDTKTCQVMDNHDSYGLQVASQESAENGQKDDETFRAALQNGLLTK